MVKCLQRKRLRKWLGKERERERKCLLDEDWWSAIRNAFYLSVLIRLYHNYDDESRFDALHADAQFFYLIHFQSQNTKKSIFCFFVFLSNEPEVAWVANTQTHRHSNTDLFLALLYACRRHKNRPGFFGTFKIFFCFIHMLFRICWIFSTSPLTVMAFLSILSPTFSLFLSFFTSRFFHTLRTLLKNEFRIQWMAIESLLREREKGKRRKWGWLSRVDLSCFVRVILFVIVFQNHKTFSSSIQS